MNQGASYFNTEEYLVYLQTHCSTNNTEAQGRVAGSDMALEMIRLLSIQPGARVLEIGCGVGRILHRIRASFGAEVVGCDVSRPAIEHVRATDPVLADCVHCCSSNALDFLPTASVDHIVTWGVFELTDQRRTLIEMARVLRPGGRALLGSVKNQSYLADDEDSLAAHRAYIAKSIPISFTDIAQLERLLGHLGMAPVTKAVFRYKRDLTAGRYQLEPGVGAGEAFAEAVYVVEKLAQTPLDKEVNVRPADREVKHGA